MIKKIVFALLFALFAFSAFAQDDPVEMQVRQIIEQNFATLNSEDLAAHELTIHPDSPFIEQTLTQMSQIFASYDLEYGFADEVLYLTTDGDYAYARVAQVTRKLAGPDFRDNRIDQIWVFKPYNGEWRVWTSQVLEITYLE